MNRIGTVLRALTFSLLYTATRCMKNSNHRFTQIYTDFSIPLSIHYTVFVILFS